MQSFTQKCSPWTYECWNRSPFQCIASVKKVDPKSSFKKHYIAILPWHPSYSSYSKILQSCRPCHVKDGEKKPTVLVAFGLSAILFNETGSSPATALVWKLRPLFEGCRSWKQDDEEQMSRCWKLLRRPFTPLPSLNEQAPSRLSIVGKIADFLSRCDSHRYFCGILNSSPCLLPCAPA